MVVIDALTRLGASLLPSQDKFVCPFSPSPSLHFVLKLDSISIQWFTYTKISGNSYWANKYDSSNRIGAYEQDIIIWLCLHRAAYIKKQQTETYK